MNALLNQLGEVLRSLRLGLQVRHLAFQRRLLHLKLVNARCQRIIGSLRVRRFLLRRRLLRYRLRDLASEHGLLVVAETQPLAQHHTGAAFGNPLIKQVEQGHAGEAAATTNTVNAGGLGVSERAVSKAALESANTLMHTGGAR